MNRIHAVPTIFVRFSMMMMPVSSHATKAGRGRCRAEAGRSVRCDCCGAHRWVELFTENGISLGQCPECDLLSIADIPTSGCRMTELEEGHYAGAKRVLGAQQQIAAERVLENQFQEYVDLASRHVPAGRWLDVGCGGGLLLTLARRAGYAGEGIRTHRRAPPGGR